jgi:hypothetical protein
MKRLWTVFSFALVAVGLAVLVAGSGCSLGKPQTERQRLTEKAKRLAAPKLAEYDIREFADDANAIKVGSDVLFSVTFHDRRPHLAEVEFHVVDSGDTEKWEIRYVLIDREIVFDSE